MADDAPTPTLADIWPPARIVVRTPRLELRLPNEAEMLELAEVATEPIHDPDYMPFSMPWTDAPLDDLRRNTLAFYWQTLAEWKPEAWRLYLVAFVDGRPVGVQDINATDFVTHRSVASGSWLTAALHGQGFGAEMRQALLALAFAGLDAREATSKAHADNAASLRVSEKCGYAVIGEDDIEIARGVRAPGGPATISTRRFRLAITREQWLTNRRSDITVSGIDDDVRGMLGISSLA